VFETNRSVFGTNPFDSLLVKSNLVAVLGLEHQEPFVFAYLPRD
jgi:hypothetical protein